RRPRGQRQLAAVAAQVQARLAPAPGHLEEVLVDGLLFRAADGWARLQQAQRREGLEEAHLVAVHAHGIGGRAVQRPHLDVLDAAPAQRAARALARARHALGTDGAVVLVLDLQPVGVELDPAAVALDAELLVLRVRRGHRVPQVAQVLLEAVGRHADAGLVAIAVADVAHAQRG